jgi:hypothetical protein
MVFPTPTNSFTLSKRFVEALLLNTILPCRVKTFQHRNRLSGAENLKKGGDNQAFLQSGEKVKNVIPKIF